MKIMHIRELQNRSREDISPFTLSVQGKDLVCDKILRLLPGKRITVEATFENTRGVAKILYEPRKAEAAFHYEQKMHDTLKTLGFDIPHCLFAKHSDLKNAYVTFYEKVENQALPLDALYIEKLNTLMLKLHQQHLIHLDPHPDNFLFDGQHFILLDFSAIQATHSERALKKNLALFYAQFPASAIPLLEKLCPQYANLGEDIHQSRWVRGQQYLKKLFRNTSHLKRLRAKDHLIMLDRQFDSEALREFLRFPKKHLQTAQILKAGRTSTVFLTEIAGHAIVVKRFNIKNPWKILKHLFKPSRAHRNWRYGHLLTLFGISTPTPVAMIEQRFWPFRLRAYYLTTLAPGRPLSEISALVNHPKIAKKMDLLLAEFKALRISHGDMKASNFIVNDEQLFVLDLDAMHWHQHLKDFKIARKKDLQRLARNWTHPVPANQVLMEVDDVSYQPK